MRKQYEPEKPAPKTEKKDDEPPKPIQKYDAYVKYMERKKDIIDQGRHSRLKSTLNTDNSEETHFLVPLFL